MRNLILIISFLVIICISCKKTYEPLNHLSDYSKTFLPFVPGDTIAFVNDLGYKIEFVSDFDQKTTSFVHTRASTCEMCGWGRLEVKELYKSSCFSSNHPIQIKANIDWQSTQITGDEFEILVLSLDINGSEKKLETIADDVDNWEDNMWTWGGGYNNDMPYISYRYFDTLEIGQQFYYKVFTPKNSYDFYYSQEKGIIAIEYDSWLWVNEKYR